MADERRDEPGWWSDAPLGSREQDMSPASRKAMGGDPLGISGRGATEPDEEGLGAATQDALDTQGDQDTQREQTDLTGVNPPDAQSGQLGQLGTTGYGGPFGQTGEMGQGVQADQDDQTDQGS